MTDGNRKGQEYMRKVCGILARWAGGTFRPRPTFVEPSEGWKVKGDVQHDPKVRFPFTVECKKVEGWSLDGLVGSTKWPVWAWWLQCTRQAESARNTHPLLIFSRNGWKNYVLANAETLEWLRVEPIDGPIVTVARPSSPPVALCLLDDVVRKSIPRS